MKRKSWPCVLLMGPLFAHAGEGTSGLDFLSIFPSARSAALGGAGSALGDDGATAALNPAGWGLLPRAEVFGSKAQGGTELDVNDLGFALPTMRHGTWTGRLTGLDYGEVPGYDPGGSPTGSTHPRGLWAQAGWGGPSPFKRTRWGTSLHYAEETLPTIRGHAMFLDAGILSDLPRTRFFPEARLGMALGRLGPDISYGDSKVPLPWEIRLGAASRYGEDRFRCSMDLVQIRNTRPAVHLGLEYVVSGTAFFRMGYDSSRSAERGFSYGLGFRVADLQMDYAFVPGNSLEDTHRLSLSFRFGHLAQRHFAEGMSHLREKEYARAVVSFSRALAADPRHPEAARRLREAAAFLDGERQEATP